MADDHIIRVIIQAYNELSGPLKKAVDESIPELNKLNKKLNESRREHDRTGASFSSMSDELRKEGVEIDNTRNKLEKLGASVKKVREEANKKGFLGQIASGIQAGREASSGTDREIKKSLEQARRARTEAKRAIDLDFKDQLLNLNVIANKEKERLRQKFVEERAFIKERENALKQETSAFKEQERQIKATRDTNIARLKSEAESFKRIRVEANQEKRAAGVSAEDKKALQTVIDRAENNRKARLLEISAVEKAAQEEIAGAKAASAERISGINKEIDLMKKARTAETEQSRISSVDIDRQRQANILRRDAEDRKRGLPGIVDPSEVRAGVLSRRGNGINELSGVEKAAAKASSGITDLRRGFNGARRDLSAFSGEALKGESTMTKIGAAFGDAASNIGKVVNIRWTLIISAIQTIGTLAVVAAANLISLASSAVFAAGALGGAFLAAAAQAVPVIGLLAATFQQLQNAIKVVQLRQKARDSAGVDAIAQAKAERTAVQGLADANYSLKQAQQGVLDANIGLRDSHERLGDALRAQKLATTDLAKARLDAARGIIDAATREKDAELSLKDANLGVLDAKQKLRQFERQNSLDRSGLKDAQNAVREAQQRLIAAKAEGDAAEISAATNQLGVSQQNLSAIQDTVGAKLIEHKQLILGVSQAEEAQRKARIEQRRAIQDNRRAKALGVEGSPGVIAALEQQRQANRQVRDSIEGIAAAERRRADAEHSVAIAVRSIANSQTDVALASRKMSDAQRNAQREFNKLSLPEQKFVQAAERLVRAYRKLVRPLTDVITSAITRLIDNVIKVLSDPKIQAALKTLADSIAAGIDKFGKFLSDPETRRQLTTFITEAAKNMPKIVDAFLSILQIVMNIAEAAAPIFSGLLTGADNLFARAKRWTAPRERRTAPRDPRLSRLEPVGQTTPGKTTQEKSPLEKFLDKAKTNLDSWLKLIGAITNFITALFGGAEPSGNTLVGQLATFFNNLADWLRDNPQKVHKFFEDMRIALTRIGKVLGPLVVKIVEAFSSKGAQNFTEFVLTVVIPAIITMIGIVQAITGALVAMTKVPVFGSLIKQILTVGIALALITKLFPVLKIISGFKSVGGAILYAIGFMYRFIRVARAVGIAEALMAVPFSAWLVVAGLVVLAVILILKHFHLLGPTIKALGKIFDAAVGFVRNFATNFVELIQHPIRWLQKHWKTLLLGAILGPFGLLTAAINNVFPGIFRAIKNGFTHALSAVPGIFTRTFNGIVNQFKDLPGRIGGAIKGIGEKLKDFFGGIHVHIKTRFGIPTGFKITTGGNSSTSTETQTESAARGQTIVNEFKRLAARGLSRQQAIAAERKRHPNLGFDDAQFGVLASAAGYAIGGEVGGPRGTDTVPAWLTPGEWVLNKAQQLQIARRLGTTVDAARMLLFGSGGANPSNTVSGSTVSEHGRWTGYHDFDVHTSVDDNGIPVNFIRFKDGTWGQITRRAAARIASTNGSWVPGYATRASRVHGGLFETARPQYRRIMGLRSDAFDRRFAMGGVVSAVSSGIGVGPHTNDPAGRSGNSVTQHFNVNTQGDSDWNAIMRIGAIHAQESY